MVSPRNPQEILQSCLYKRVSSQDTPAESVKRRKFVNPMPILFPEFKEDYEAIGRIADKTAQFWNDYGSNQYGFKVFTALKSIERVSQQGDLILGSYFPDEPGPFKRLAALLILAKLEPLFHLGTLGSRGGKDFTRIEDIAKERDWLPRICYLMIPLIFKYLRVKREGLPDIKLTDWKGFPSAHSKSEFFLWLQWIRLYNNQQIINEENLVILGRRVMSAALILEAVYFQGKVTSKLCGVCDHKLDLTDSVYESVLWENKLRAEGREE